MSCNVVSRLQKCVQKLEEGMKTLEERVQSIEERMQLLETQIHTHRKRKEDKELVTALLDECIKNFQMSVQMNVEALNDQITFLYASE